MKEWLSQPGFLGTHGTLGTDTSFVMAIVFTILFIVGWRMAKQHETNRHHTLVLWAMVSMLIYFTFYYLAQGLGALATEGKEGFGGPDLIYNYVFKPILTIHIFVVTLGLIMAVYMIVLGFRAAIKRNGIWALQLGPKIMGPWTLYKLLGSAFVLFAILGAIRWDSFARLKVYIYGFLIVAVVILAEKGVQWWIPDGERRHRVIGTFTMVLYAIALITSMTTYALLYIVYPPAVHPL